MHRSLLTAIAIALLAQASAHASNDKYLQQLERSGCTQASELQGCDITKSKAENAKAGFGTPAATGKQSYQQQLERSGCTQTSELQGCDINKTREENAKAGFSSQAPAVDNQHPYMGQWVAKGTAGATVATIRIDKEERVWVNGERVKAKRTDGTLQFTQGMITYTIQGDRRLKNEDYWVDRDAGSKGPILPE